MLKYLIGFAEMWRRSFSVSEAWPFGVEGLAQSAVDVVRPEERQKTQRDR
jgi:hypothetical protein